MNTRDLERLNTWEEHELEDLVTRYVRTFHRLPSYDELVRFRRGLSGLRLRIPKQGRRRLATVIAGR